MSVGDIMAKGKNHKKNSKKNNGSKNIKKNTQINNESKVVEDIQINSEPEVVEDIKVNSEPEVIAKTDSYKNNDKKKTVYKARRDLVYSSNDSSDEMSKLLKIVLIVTGVMIIFYGITTLVTKKVNAVKTAKLGKSSEKVSIQYDSIIIGYMFKMDGHYFVLIEKENDDNSSEYDTLLKSIMANDEAPKIYTADLSSSFNKKYLDKESNYDSDLDKFKVKDTTLVEIEDHKIKDTFDSYDSIKEKLDELK